MHAEEHVCEQFSASSVGVWRPLPILGFIIALKRGTFVER